MPHELPYIAAIDEAIRLEMERDQTVLYFGQNMATTENEPYVDAFGVMKYRGDAPHPFEIELESITPLPPDAGSGVSHNGAPGDAAGSSNQRGLKAAWLKMPA